MSADIKTLVQQLLKKDFSALAPLRDLLKESHHRNHQWYLDRLNYNIGKYLTDIERWNETARIETREVDDIQLPTDANEIARLYHLYNNMTIERGSSLTLQEGVTFENLHGRDRFSLTRINERFIDSIKVIFWEELYDPQTVIQTFYDYFKLHGVSLFVELEPKE